MDSALEPDPLGEVRTNLVYARYQDWCYANAFRPEGKNEFRKSLASAGVEIQRKRPEEKRGDEKAAKESLIIGFKLKNP